MWYIWRIFVVFFIKYIFNFVIVHGGDRNVFDYASYCPCYLPYNFNRLK